MVVEVCYLSVGDVLLWRWSGALWGARVVLCRGKELCFTGDDTPVVQPFICGEKRGGVPPWGLTNLIRYDISEVAKHHILGRNYSNYFNFFPIKAHRCSGRHGCYSSGRHGSLFIGQTRGLFFGQTRESAPTRAPKAIQTPLPSGGAGGGLFPLGRGWGWVIPLGEGLGVGYSPPLEREGVGFLFSTSVLGSFSHLLFTTMRRVLPSSWRSW